MAGKNIILNLLISVILVYGVNGERNAWPENTSSEQFRAKQKLPVKRVTTEHGDVYDCIDFFDQPAFDHPMLNKHDYHPDMKPSFMREEIPEKTKRRSRSKGVGCPRGTVPIRRTNAQNLIEETTSHPDSQTDGDAGLIFYAGTATKDGIGKIYGAESTLSLDNPKLYDDSQSSSNIISVEAGAEAIHVGTTVNPKLNGDYNTRFYIWTRGARATCYNLICPGFVITNTEAPLDRILKAANSTSKTRFETRVVVRLEKESGRWWLVENFGKPIGFWPRVLFNTLPEGAYKVYFGGVAKASSGRTSFPQMGLGDRPHNNRVHGNGVSRRMMLINQDGVEEYAADKSDILETLSERYVARNLHMHWWNRQKAYASTLLFGGS